MSEERAGLKERNPAVLVRHNVLMSGYPLPRSALLPLIAASWNVSDRPNKS
jgi:hypothetical protein